MLETAKLPGQQYRDVLGSPFHMSITEYQGCYRYECQKIGELHLRLNIAADIIAQHQLCQAVEH